MDIILGKVNSDKRERPSVASRYFKRGYRRPRAKRGANRCIARSNQEEKIGTAQAYLLQLKRKRKST